MAKRPVGRPTDYDPKYIEMLIEYFDVKPYKACKTSLKKKMANDFPTLAGFAIKIGVCRDTLQEWAKVHPEFSAAYKKSKDFQERFLVTNGLHGLVDTAFGIFTAKNVLKWRDKQEDEGDSDKPIKISVDEVDL